MACDLHCGHTIVLSVAGASVLLTLIISFFQVGKHLKHYTNPHFQRRTIIIILMAPFYALTSFSTIVTNDTTGYFNLVRDVYEAVLIYAFFNLLASYIAYDEASKEIDYDKIYEALSTKGIRSHIFPVNLFFKPMVLISKIRGEWHFQKSRLCILQYLAIKPFTSFALIIVDLIDSESPVGYLFKGMAGISVFVSVYYLVLFYQLLHPEMDAVNAKPLLKFLSVKGILFFTFWQDFVVEIGVQKGTNYEKDIKEFIIMDLENMLVCVEMVILTIMTTIAFSYTNFRLSEKGFRKREGALTLTRKLMNDVLTDGWSEAVNDLKDLQAPLMGPWKKYNEKDAKTPSAHLMMLTSKINNKLVDEMLLSEEQKVKIFQVPIFIPEFYPDGREPPSPTPVKIQDDVNASL